MFDSIFYFIPVVLSWALIGRRQKYWGQFSWWGVFFPVSLLVYVGVTVLAVADLINGRKMKWRGRDYSI